MRLHGKDEQSRIVLPEGASLLQFASQRPSWDPARRDGHGKYLGPAEAKLSWSRLSTLASTTFVGTMDGRRLYSVAYSRYYLVILSEQGDWSFCPSLILDADAGWDAGQVVAFVGKPEIFRWQQQDVMSLRVYYRGNGAEQESLFLATVDDHVVYLTQETFGERMERDGWQLRTRGGGFCRTSLRWVQLADKMDATHGIQTAEVKVVYRISMRRLVIDSLTYTPADEPAEGEPCELYYESPGAG
jgi:hypothetical protein